MIGAAAARITGWWAGGKVRTPTILQMRTTDCGPVALAIVLAFFGRHVSVDQLRTDCGAGRDGSTAKTLIAAARQYGLTAKGFRRSAAGALEGPFPAIVFWNFNHFLVLEGAAGDRVFLNDPARGRHVISREAFARSYSSVLMTFEPNDAFVAAGAPAGTLRSVLSRNEALRARMWSLLGLGALIAVPGFLVAGSTVLFVNEVLINGLAAWLPSLLLFLCGIVVLQGALVFLREAMLARMTSAASATQSASVLWRVLRLPSSYFDAHELGEVAGRISQVEEVAQVSVSELGRAVAGLATIVVLFALMTMLSPFLAAISLAGALVNVFALRLIHNVRIDAATRWRTEKEALNSIAVTGLRTMTALKARRGEDDFFQRWAGSHARTNNAWQRLLELDHMAAIVPPVVAIATMAVALWVGGDRVMDSVMTLGALLAYQTLFASIASPIQHLMHTVGATERLSGDMARLDDVMNHPLDWRHAPKTASRFATRPSQVALELCDLSFGTAAHTTAILDHVSFKVPAGSHTAVVGPTGSGKSALGRLIVGLETPTGGRITLNGVALDTLDRLELAGLVALVGQDVKLFRGTVRDNITLWDQTVPYADLEAAMEDAGLAGFLAARQGGLDAVIAEAGHNISSGERQQLGLARALVRQPALLVLDASMHALDPTTEQRVLQALRRRGTTAILIGQQLRMVRRADGIIVLDSGRVVGKGQHDVLLNDNPTYRTLFATEVAE
ncbi:MAG: cysteine peptidase family C39 domain-containing protein [Pseudomonadota bacterium]